MTTDPTTGIVPVATTRVPNDLPADLASPRVYMPTAFWVGIISGGVLIALDAALVIFVLLSHPS